MTPRIYLPILLSNNKKIDLPIDIIHYLNHVLRLKNGHLITLFNGLGGEYKAIVELSKKKASATITEYIDRDNRSKIEIHLGQAISRSDRMDLTLMKATELGVYSVSPLQTSKCLTKIKSNKIDKKHLHWEKILISAAEQSGRTDVPVLNHAQSLENWVQSAFDGCSIIMCPHSENIHFNQLSISNNKIRLLIGPESGFDDGEVELAKKNHFIPIKLGNRILRTETAALAMISVLQSQFGDFK